MALERGSLSRRGFRDRSLFALTAGAGLPLWYAREVAAEQSEKEADTRRGPNDQIDLAAIGVGGQGTGIMKWAKRKPNVKFVAVCDVDANRRKKAAAEVGKGCREYADFRELLDKEKLDAVTVGTVDHWHALTSIAAMKHGCDVYCEKPLTLTIEEGKAMVKAARKYDRVFQTGSQQRSDARYRLACELVRNGRIGKVHTVEARIGDNPIGGPFPETSVPEGLDWNFWKGPTADVPYVKERCHYEFRWWYEYSGGKMTDWGAHHVDIAQWAIGMDNSGPTEIEGLKAVHPVPFKDGYPTVDNEYNTATEFQIRCLFPNGVELLIVHGSPDGNGILFEGTKGRFHVSRSAMKGKPAEDLEKNPISDDLITKLYKGKKPGNHMGNFFECVKSRELPISDVYTHHRAITTCHLANIAIRLGRKIQWNPETQQIVGDKDAQKWQSREQRKGYEINV